MGASMCGHLLDAGFSATVYNRTRAKAEPLLARGAAGPTARRPWPRPSDVIFTIVGYPADVRAGDSGRPTARWPAAGRAIMIVDMTTSEPSLAVRLPRRPPPAACTASMPRSPAATSAPAKPGLSIMVGGDAEVVEPCSRCWQAMGKTFVRQGGPGAGQHAKMVNQILIAGNMVGVCEALLYAYKAGLDLER